MCGIAGIIGKQAFPEPKAVQEMLDTIYHRGPDGQGIYCDGHLVLGHRRLAIIDLRPEGNQPMPYTDRYTIVHNGEVYNYIELRDELQKLGHSFVSETDTEVIAAAYAQWGVDCERRFNGMWAFAIYDKQEQTLFLSRDRFGVKPLYYRSAPDTFTFGSEIKEIWIHMPKPVKANEGVLLAYLSDGQFDYSEQTCFEEIKQLRGGHHMIYDLKTNNYEIKQWYSLGAKRKKTKDTYEQSVQKTKELFDNALRLRLRSDVPVGSTLSGGLDSSSIVCSLRQILPDDKPLITISSCFEEKAFDEQEYIDAVIEHANIVSHKIWPELKLDIESLDKDIWQEDEPFTSSAGRAVYEKAKELGLTVMLVGEGADEHLAGYTPFFECLFLELILSGRFRDLICQLKKYKELRAPNDSKSLKHMLLITAADFFFSAHIRDFIRLHRKSYVPSRFLSKRCLNHKEVYKARNLYTSTSTDEVIKSYLTNEMPRILHALDRNSMACSIETRAPFLDIELIEASMNMPLSHKLWDGITKRVLRDAESDVLPESIKNRYGKMGFMSPEFQWFYEDPEGVTELLADACDALGSYVDKTAVLAWCAEHKASAAKAGEEEYLLSRLLKIGRWMKVFQAEL